MEPKINRLSGARTAGMQFLHQSAVVKKELSQKEKLLIYRSIYVPTRTWARSVDSDRKNDDTSGQKELWPVGRLGEDTLRRRTAAPSNGEKPAEVAQASWTPPWRGVPSHLRKTLRETQDGGTVARLRSLGAGESLVRLLTSDPTPDKWQKMEG